MAKKILPLVFIVFICFWGGGRSWPQSPAFSGPQRIATLSWTGHSRPGIPRDGAEWLVVDNQGRFWLEENLDFHFFTREGRYIQTIHPVDKRMNFYGFIDMEAIPGGGIALLQRMETLVEQREKDNFEIESKPGARLIVLDGEGKILRDRYEVDLRQPHSDYDLLNGVVYSIHDDGSYEMLDSIVPPLNEKDFRMFAAVADPVRWNDHIRTLPVFRFESGFYHDVQGNLHEDKDAKSFLMSRPFVEGLAPTAERNGKIYGQVICYRPGGFTYGVFVEDSVRRKYAFVDLVAADQGLETAYDHAIFIDPKGNLYEGVAKKDGYRIYEWKANP